MSENNPYLQKRIVDAIKLPEDAWPKLDELTGDIRTVAELIGIGHALLLAQVFDGSPIRIGGWKAIVRRWRDNCIRRDYDTGNHTIVDLARKNGLTDRQVSSILGRTDYRQLKLF